MEVDNRLTIAMQLYSPLAMFLQLLRNASEFHKNHEELSPRYYIRCAYCGVKANRYITFSIWVRLSFYSSGGPQIIWMKSALYARVWQIDKTLLLLDSWQKYIMLLEDVAKIECNITFQNGGKYSNEYYNENNIKVVLLGS